MRLSLRRLHLAGVLYLLALLCVAALANPKYFKSTGTTLIVTTTADNGPGSLRDAIAVANPGDVIGFFGLEGQTITLTSGELVINKTLTINGPGPSVLAVSRDQQAPNFRIFHIMPGFSAEIRGLTISGGQLENENGGGVFNDQATLTISNCAISGNNITAFCCQLAGGGGISNNGTLSLIDSTVSSNTAIGGWSQGGGGISTAGTLTITHSTISGNSADEFAGGITNNGTLMISYSTISNNQTHQIAHFTGRGGGIYSGGGILTIDNCIISANMSGLQGGSVGGYGGGVYGSVTITNSTISGNTGRYQGGGIYGNGTISNSTISDNVSFDGGGIYGSFTIRNSTISSNTVVSGHGGGIFGGGSITNTTISGNSAPEGGGIYANSAVDLGNTILKTGPSGANIVNNGGTITSHGYNLGSDNGGGFLTGPGDQINTDPLLGPLQDNGGPTFTHDLLAGSPAIDAGDPNFTPPPSTDQRGYPRVYNGRIDIGSVEVQPIPTPTPSPTATATASPSPSVTPPSGVVFVSRLSDARAYAEGGAGIVAPPPQIQTDFLPAMLSNSANSVGEPGAADGHCTSNSQIAVDNQSGTLQISGDGMAAAAAFIPGAPFFGGLASAKLMVINFTLTDRSYSYSLTGQLSANGVSGSQGATRATAKLTRGNVTIFERIADNSTLTLSETGILQPDNYTLAVDISAFGPAPDSFSNSSANFNFSLNQAPTPTPTSTPTPSTPGPATHFTFVAPPDVIQYVPFTFTVTARDQFGKVAIGYAGTVHFTSSDTGSGTQLPNDSTLTHGTGAFDVTLTTPDYQTITATDTINSSITGTSSTILVFAAEASPTPTPTPTPSPTATATASATASPSPATAQLLNISTRVRVETGDNVMIGGFIINGAGSLQVVIRGIGPSLGPLGIPDFLPDPVIELRDSSGALIVTNDNWQDDPAQAAQLTKLGLAPGNQAESALVRTLQPGAYTVTVAGNNEGTGIGLVEVYNVDHSVPVGNIDLANISTRGFVQAGNNVMIGGFILTGASSENAQVAVRGIGPSLTQFGITNALTDPTLELRDGNGALLIANDNWQDDSASAGQLSAHGLAPSDPLESGIFISLQPGLYTAILAGTNAGTGIGLVEVYNVN